MSMNFISRYVIFLLHVMRVSLSHIHHSHQKGRGRNQKQKDKRVINKSQAGAHAVLHQCALKISAGDGSFALNGLSGHLGVWYLAQGLHGRAVKPELGLNPETLWLPAQLQIELLG